MKFLIFSLLIVPTAFANTSPDKTKPAPPTKAPVERAVMTEESASTADGNTAPVVESTDTATANSNPVTKSDPVSAPAVSPVIKSANKATAGKNVEKIKVTGSRIKRIDLEGPNPITVYSAEDLEVSGYHSVGDFLRNTTLAPFGVVRGRAGSSGSGNSFIEIKGESTLILINGLRVAEDPEAHAVDLNLIPMNAIERIEVLRNGGSALYGSDALGGVINFITKKDFSGVSLHADLTPTLYPFWQGLGFKKPLDDYFAGSSASAGTVFGTTGRDWSVIGTYTIRFQENIRLNQRKWGTGLVSATGPEAIFYNADLEEIPPDSKCPKDKTGRSSQCPPFDYTPYADFTPKYFQSTLFLQGNYETNDMQLYAQYLGSYKIDQYYYAPIPVNERMKPELRVNNTQRLRHRFMQTDKRDTITHNWLADLTVGAKGYISKTWDYDASLKGAHIIKNRIENNVLLLDKTVKAIDDKKYDPLSPTKEGLKDAIYNAKSKTNSSLIFGSVDFSGNTNLGFDVATGIQAYWQRYQNKADTEQTNGKYGNIIAGVGSDGDGNRYVGSAYVEAIKNVQEMLELQLTWRADYYSDFGLSNFGLRELFEIEDLEFLDYLIGTPKIAFRFQPQSNVLFRGSVSSAFKAPDLSSLKGGSSSSFPYLLDTVGCVNQLDQDLEIITKDNKDLLTKFMVYGKEDLSADELVELKKIQPEIENKINNAKKDDKDYPCIAQQYSVNFNSNKNLKPTQALGASIGSVLELTDNLNVNIDISYIQKNGGPASGVNDSNGIGKKLFDAEALGKENLIKQIVVEKERKNNRLSNLTVQISNLQQSRKLFLDLGLRSNLIFVPVPTGNVYFNDDLTVFLIHQSEDFPTFGLENQIGEFGNPRWVNRAMVGWKNKKQNLFLNLFSVASFKKLTGPSYFPISTRFDINYEYLFSEKTKLSFNFYNLLNLGLNFKKAEGENLLSLSTDIPADMDGPAIQYRITPDIHNIHGAHFNVRLSHLL